MFSVSLTTWVTISLAILIFSIINEVFLTSELSGCTNRGYLL